MHNIRLFLVRNNENLRHFMKSTIINNVPNVVNSTQSTNPLSPPPPDSINRPANPKLQKLVNDIAQLNLLEVSELSGLLKKTLNLPDAPAMSPFGVGYAPAVPTTDDDEEAVPKKAQTVFKVKLMKFDEKQKVPLIKEIKALLEGMNLVQAKKFVESAPTIVKEDISKDEAEKLKESLQKVGAVIEIE